MKWLRSRKKVKVDTIPSAQNERIEVLKAEISRLESKIEAYEKREKEIEEVLLFAKSRAEEYEKEAKIRYNLERERLYSYREKWQNRIKELGEADSLGEEILECNEYFKKIADDLRNIVEGKNPEANVAEESYLREKERLREIGVSSEGENVLSEEDLNKLLLQFNY